MYKNSTMTISTGVMAVAQARYGYSNRALELLSRMFSTFSMATPGAISEMSPDYGCFVQAWTAYATLVPITGYFFGLQPDAFQNRVVVTPQMPDAWESAKLEEVHVLGGVLHLAYEVKEGNKRYQIAGECGVPVFFRIPAGEAWTVNGQSYVPEAEERMVPVQPLSKR